jgi:hypothetical protein
MSLDMHTTEIEYVIFSIDDRSPQHPGLVGGLDESGDFYTSSFSSRKEAKAYAEQYVQRYGRQAFAVKAGSARYHKWFV